jgi:hypothetical protein
MSGTFIGNYLTLINQRTNNRGTQSFQYVCVCGNTITLCESIKDKYKSCGCIQRKRSQTISENYNEYTSWRSLFERCNNHKNAAFKDYGARGITVSNRWLDFANFLEDMGKRPEGHSLDRIDNNLGYEPKNCRWATRVDQNNNTRSNRRVKYQGKQMTLAELSREVDVRVYTLRGRLESGMTVEEAVHKDVPNTGKPKTVIQVETGRVFNSLTEAAKITNCDRSGISQAIKRGYKAGGFHWVLST